MDTVIASLLALVLAGFAAIAAIESRCKPAPLIYEEAQKAAAERGEGEYFTDCTGNIRYRHLKGSCRCEEHR